MGKFIYIKFNANHRGRVKIDKRYEDSQTNLLANRNSIEM